ncbi:hypothetical protein McpCs1_16630 [Methanocorpusculaceae archaeon Cs1]|uniref:Nickel transporter n=2 Tax=Methanorbis rubei TaxID=3028300 RepID=A0AAE4SC59_9EURY|nr:hypothetical protein [Methanocorpusculaceae archaeon Cs1]
MVFTPNKGIQFIDSYGIYVVTRMDVVLAVDLKGGYVVHGSCGNRANYLPLNWGLSPSAEPSAYLSVMEPKYLYAADLDRIEFSGDHTKLILRLADFVDGLWVDRGCSIPEEYLCGRNIHNIVGTETIDAPMDEFMGGFLSVDVKDGHVVARQNFSQLLPSEISDPSGVSPEDVLRLSNDTNFAGCVLLNISSVGTSSGIDAAVAESLRSCCEKTLFYGGGVRSTEDLATLADAGFDGAIVSTAVHKGTVPLKIIQEGSFC